MVGIDSKKNFVLAVFQTDTTGATGDCLIRTHYCAEIITPSGMIVVDESNSSWYGIGGDWIKTGLPIMFEFVLVWKQWTIITLIFNLLSLRIDGSWMWNSFKILVVVKPVSTGKKLKNWYIQEYTTGTTFEQKR